jgi:hypothetical protein
MPEVTDAEKAFLDAVDAGHNIRDARRLVFEERLGREWAPALAVAVSTRRSVEDARKAESDAFEALCALMFPNASERNRGRDADYVGWVYDLVGEKARER